MVAKYDVFINHRGPDVKETFVSHLYAALQGAGFRPFVDAESIRQGTHALESINEALQGASVHVAIFSKGYAESPYCLDELCDMLKTGKVILPVFYDVDPADLRRFEVKRPFAVAFEKHCERGRDERIGKWKKALHDVSNMMGRIIQKDNVIRNEHQLITSIVLSVKREMPTKMLPSKQRFGLEASLKEVLSILDSMTDDVRVVGLCGMGGIGKTTLAVEVYNHFVSHGQYEQHCFLKDVRSNQALGSQKRLLKDLTGNVQEILEDEDYSRGLNALRCKRVFLVIDDIDDANQFENLVPDIHGLGPGSRVVITSRDEDVLKRAMRTAVCANVYKMNVLSLSESRQLFNWHAFLSQTADEEFSDLAVTIADACGGLPLALEVMGAMFYTKQDPGDREIWKEAVQALRENETIFGTLRISYDFLDEGEKSMFRDIACLMIGFDEDVAMAIWKSCEQCSRSYCLTSKTPAKALRTLRDRSLVKVESGKLSMHDVLRDMGRDIVIGKGKKRPKVMTHLWEADTISKVLSRNKDQEASGVRGINFFRSGSNVAIHSQASKFACMEELHILVLDDIKIEPDDFSKWSQALRFLRWKWTMLCDGIPTDLKLSNLVVMDLRDNYCLERLWKDSATVQFPALRMLFLDQCSTLKKLPDSFGLSLPLLQTLTMWLCGELEWLPESVAGLVNLKKLDLSVCSSLRALPKKFGSLVNLEYLSLEGCSALTELPASIGSLVKLEDLSLGGCRRLSKLPASFGGLKMLKRLTMDKCGVRELPMNFGGFSCLRFLSFEGFLAFEASPNELRSVTSYVEREQLNFGGRLISSWEAFEVLRYLRLSCHRTITSLPKSIGSLKFLVHLEMRFCLNLQTVEALPPSLHHLDLNGNKRLIGIASFGEMRSLVFLDLAGCNRLRHVNGLDRLEALQYVNLSDCMSIEDRVVLGRHKARALCECYLSGSGFQVTYNNKWLEEEPALQQIVYHDTTIGFLPNNKKGLVEVPFCKKGEVIIEVSITSKSKCVALVLCFTTMRRRFTFFMVIEIWRNDKWLLGKWNITCGKCDGQKEVVVYTFRKAHPIMQKLQCGDRLRVYRPKYNYQEEQADFMAGEVAVCVVHEDDEGLVFAVNSEVLCRSRCEDLAKKFDRLLLADDSPPLYLSSTLPFSEEQILSLRVSPPLSRTTERDRIIDERPCGPLLVRALSFGNTPKETIRNEPSTDFSPCVSCSVNAKNLESSVNKSL